MRPAYTVKLDSFIDVNMCTDDKYNGYVYKPVYIII